MSMTSTTTATVEDKMADTSGDMVAAAQMPSEEGPITQEAAECSNFSQIDGVDADANDDPGADADADADTEATLTSSAGILCHYFQRGMCRFGSFCRFSHDVSLLPNQESFHYADNNKSDVNGSAFCDLSCNQVDNPGPSTSRNNWAKAPEFIPKAFRGALNEDGGYDGDGDDDGDDDGEAAAAAITMNRTWAEIVGNKADPPYMNTLNGVEVKRILELCPYESPCPFKDYCGFAFHMELCEMCDRFCLHPTDDEQRKDHKKECLKQHEQAMELSFAIARSKDKTCGICFDTIMEKAGHEKRFGILPNCNHIFCLECIRKWRKAKQFEHKIIRSCPECRVCSDFVCPSAFWVESKEDKEKLLDDYRKALGTKDCKYFKKGNGKCPFGNKCFYKHALPNGVLVDVGCPKKARKMVRSNNEIINLLDMYLYEFLEQRDLNFLDFLATSTSDDSDQSEY